MPDTQKKFYLTTPIYYVNARPHIGHAYTTIAADVIARRQRLLLGTENVWFLTGTDEHGQKVQRSAEAAGITPQQFTDQVSAQFRSLWQRMGITYNDYIRTTETRHTHGVQHLFAQLYSRGYIYLDTYTGQYSVGEEMFVDGPPGTLGPDGKPTETVTEENFYFRLSAFQARLIDLIESGEFCIEPEARRNEVLSFLRGNVPSNASGASSSVPPAASISESVLRSEAKNPSISPGAAGSPGAPSMTQSHRGMVGNELSSPAPETIAYSAKGNPYVAGALKDLSISRSSFDWGISVPEPAASTTQKKHVIYVWFDALTNYMTAVGYGSEDPAQQALYEKFWPADLHLVGKEIIRMHCVYWPAFLLAADLPLPKKVQAHGWLLFEESKMSKSRGNIVRTETILDAFGTLKAPAASDVLSAPAASGGLSEPAASGVLSAPAASAGLSAPAASAGLSAPAASAGLSSRSEAEGSASPELPQPPTKAEQDLFGSDVLRYFLLREIPFGQDGSFSFDALVQRYNSDLANGYGNLVSRTLNMIGQYFDGNIPTPLSGIQTGADYAFAVFVPLAANNTPQNLRADALSAMSIFDAYFIENNFTACLSEIWALVTRTDGFITRNAPWNLRKAEDSDTRNKVDSILYAAAEAIRIITALLYPILPYSTAKVWAQLGLGDIEAAARSGELNNLQWGGLKPGTKLGPLGPIFPRADKGLIQIMTDAEQNPVPPTPSKFVDEKTTHTSPAPSDPTHPGAAPRTSILPHHDPASQVGASSAPVPDLARPPAPHTEVQASGIFAGSAAAETSQIAIDDFVKIDLRVAKVLVAERIPKADKLLRLEVDLGYEKRQILSGIAQWYAPEDLIGRRIIIVANLAPRKMRGLESHGMLLAASHGEDGKPILATFADSDKIELGSRLK